jgi:preprotein translocase subunit SecG
MTTVLVVLHLLITVTMIGLILLQKTEGNASGAGFSGSASVESLMRPRARPNPITRATTILGIAFFATSVCLAVLARPDVQHRATSIMSEPVAHAPVVPKINENAPPPPATPAAPAATPAAPAAPTVPTK